MEIDKETLEFALLALEAAKQNRRKQLKQMPYREYLQTPEWQEKKTRARKLAGNRCEQCFRSINKNRLDTHHNRYTERGQETDGDLEILCDRCHRARHNIR